MTRRNENVARPEGYSAAEKLISWSRLGWKHVGVFAFLILASLAAGSASVIYDEVNFNRSTAYYEGLQAAALERLKLEYNFEDLPEGELRDEAEEALRAEAAEEADPYLDDIEDWNRHVWGYVMVPVFIGLGVLVDKKPILGGRFWPLITALTLFAGLLICSAFIREDLSSGNPVEIVFLYGFVSYLLIPAIKCLTALYCYEFVPLKYRLLAQLGLLLAESVGSLVTGLVDLQVSNPDLTGLTDEQKSIELSKAIMNQVKYTGGIGPAVLALLAIVVGVVFVRKNTPLASVNIDREANRVYDELYKAGVENSSEPVVMTRDEFEANTSKDLSKLEERGLTKFWPSMSHVIGGPLLVCMGAILVQTILEKIFSILYYWTAQDFMGGGRRENAEGFISALLPMMMLNNGLTLGAVVLSIALYVWMKDIRFVPPTGLLLAALGAAVCSAIKVAGNQEPLSNGQRRNITAGVAMYILGEGMFVGVFRVIAMDLFTTCTRARGLFVLRAWESLLFGLTWLIHNSANEYSWYAVVMAAVMATIGAAIFALFYTTQWFEHSLVFRDPELDACWLISSQQASGPVVGSRDKLSTNKTSSHTTSSSNSF